MSRHRRRGRNRYTAPGDVLVHLRRARDHVDRHFTEPVDLDVVAAVAGLSKFHFHRLFTAVYGVTPARYLTQRRIERAQDLLRATNLTVTEICSAVGYSSLGSFSSRFSELVGETPSAFQRRYATSGAPRIPRLLSCSCGDSRNGVRARTIPQDRRSRRRHSSRSVDVMVNNVSLVSVWVKDIEESKAFYIDVLGFEDADDVVLGDDFRWCTVGHPSQPELHVHLTTPGPPLSPEFAKSIAPRPGRRRNLCPRDLRRRLRGDGRRPRIERGRGDQSTRGAAVWRRSVDS